MSIFSPVHSVLPLCSAALFRGYATGPSAAARHGTAPALLPDPDPPAPTPVRVCACVGGGVEAVGLQDSWAELRGGYLQREGRAVLTDNAVFVHLLLFSTG